MHLLKRVHSHEWPELYLHWTQGWMFLKQLLCFPHEAQNKCCKEFEVEREKANMDLESTECVYVFKNTLKGTVLPIMEIYCTL